MIDLKSFIASSRFFLRLDVGYSYRLEPFQVFTIDIATVGRSWSSSVSAWDNGPSPSLGNMLGIQMLLPYRVDMHFKLLQRVHVRRLVCGLGPTPDSFLYVCVCQQWAPQVIRFKRIGERGTSCTVPCIWERYSSSCFSYVLRPSLEKVNGT